jgi:hypothetical protein
VRPSESFEQLNTRLAGSAANAVELAELADVILSPSTISTSGFEVEPMASSVAREPKLAGVLLAGLLLQERATCSSA